MSDIDDRLVRSQPRVAGTRRQAPMAGPQPANLADILERVLDKGIVIAGDIRINLLDIELLTIKLRLLIASVDKAKEMGIDWWEHDPTLSVGKRDLADENRRLRRRLGEMQQPDGELAEENDRLRRRLDELEEADGSGQRDEVEGNHRSRRRSDEPEEADG